MRDENVPSSALNEESKFLHPKFNVEASSKLWRFAYDLAGSNREEVILDWEFEVGAKSKFTDIQNKGLLLEFQNFMQTAITADDAGIRMEVGSIPSTFMGLRELAVFMVSRGLKSIREMTSALSWEYVEELDDQYTDVVNVQGRERKWTFSSAFKLLHPLVQFHTVSRVCKSRPIAGPSEAPFDGRSTYNVVVHSLGLQKNGRLGPIEDDISVPALSEAQMWIECGAEDLVDLVNNVMPALELARSQTGPRRNEVLKEIRSRIERFEMSTNPLTGLAWHESLEPYERTTEYGEFEVSGLQVLRRAIIEMQSACTTVIQGCTGIRSHELMGLRVSNEAAIGGGIVETSRSTDLVMDVFSLVGISAKRQETQHRWTAGFRPSGTNSLPIIVVAVDVLCRLFAYWRELSGRSDLLLSFTSAKSLPTDASNVGRMHTAKHAIHQREFAANALVRRLGISKEQAISLVRALRPQRWRPTFAHFVYRSNPKLITQLRHHFRHMSEQITDHGYIGNDPELLAELEGERTMETARMMLEISVGKMVVAGPAAALLKKHASSVTRLVEKMEGEDSLQKAAALVELADIHLWTGTYASCLINILPGKSSCNSQAAMLPRAARPNFGARSPGLCSSCQCCVILPEHQDFWEQRLKANERLVAEEQRGQTFSKGSAAGRRVAQSRSILARLTEVSEVVSADSDETPSRCQSLNEPANYGDD
ncbi:integrase [Stenotrophomonas sp. 2694]|uniref:integrase n=1 Tax=Stenotrophomonas sp. 2694 TaxID=3156317 RepID=UPI0033967C11